MLAAVVLLSLVSLSCAAVHSLKYFYTSTSGISDFPEFIGVGQVDNIEISYYDSTSKEAVPRQKWMTLDHNYWWTETQVAMGYERAFKIDMNILKDRLNQTHGVHVLQKMYGCWWDDESGAIGGSEQFGYDGEDFMVLEMHNMKWIASVPQAHFTTNKWNRMEDTLLYRKDYFHNICVNWLNKYLHYGDSTLRRTVRPSVSLVQKRPYVVRHATGFYPEQVVMTWRTDGEEIEDDVDVDETLPNEDGTFQKKTELK
ncbi:major histocompatibility complex class I-related gene protein-like [Engraulis encrasicolus]|uniref:major histocompatibility complex class I-related gene protein-like n=1 Tax=Engraulis encrasicolus TaxID=184585 RepID=UPI002FD13922